MSSRGRPHELGSSFVEALILVAAVGLGAYGAMLYFGSATAGKAGQQGATVDTICGDFGCAGEPGSGTEAAGDNDDLPVSASPRAIAATGTEAPDPEGGLPTGAPPQPTNWQRAKALGTGLGRGAWDLLQGAASIVNSVIPFTEENQRLAASIDTCIVQGKVSQCLENDKENIKALGRAIEDGLDNIIDTIEGDDELAKWELAGRGGFELALGAAGRVAAGGRAANAANRADDLAGAASHADGVPVAGGRLATHADDGEIIGQGAFATAHRNGDKVVKVINDEVHDGATYALDAADKQLLAKKLTEQTNDLREIDSTIPEFRNIAPGKIETDFVGGKELRELSGPARERAKQAVKDRVQQYRDFFGMEKDQYLVYADDGWKLDIDTNTANFRFDDNGNITGSFDPLKIVPPSSHMSVNSAGVAIPRAAGEIKPVPAIDLPPLADLPGS